MLHGPAKPKPFRLLACLAACLFAALPGCHLVAPEVSHQPVLHNPFPQLSRVAVVPFFNQSDAEYVDGHQFALAYYAELQGVPGFEVVPVGVVEAAMVKHGIDLSSSNGPSEARRLAQVLGVDAVVVGSVTDYDPYYPPRVGMRVDWYAANPGFHEIPAGYGLPWGTPEEEFIPERLVFEAEMALARAQMETQTPDCSPRSLGSPPHPMAPQLMAPPADAKPMRPPIPLRPGVTEDLPPPPAEELPPGEGQAKFDAPIDGDASAVSPDSLTTGPSGATGGIGLGGMLPPGWPDARGFTPPGPCPVRPACVPNDGPVMTHTRIFRGHDPEFTAALASYVGFRDDARFGGWQSYLERSDDLIRFCAHLHLAEMLTARGGGGETRVLRRWSESR